MTPYAALLDRMRTDPASPLLTYRNLASGERMELSAASLGNAIAKTAGLLRDELDAQPGAVVGIHLPLHWQRVVWLGACAATGTVFAPDLAPQECDVCVFDREHAGIAGQAPEDVLVSLAPFGLPEPDGAPTGVIDAAVAMRSHPDSFVPIVQPAESMPLIRSAADTVTQADAMDRARESLVDRGIQVGQRFAILDPDPMADMLALAGPLVHGSGAVLVTGTTSGDVEAVLDEEGVTRGA
jgi:uncharacterized protein (TIGR03089 family)